MTTTERRYAIAIAREIKDLEGHQDYGGKHQQAVMQFKDTVGTWTSGPLPHSWRYRHPDGTLGRSLRNAVASWADRNLTPTE